jgi:cyclomaltodextrinase / maltogenic alpha-amylase / neopullulanase
MNDELRKKVSALFSPLTVHRSSFIVSARWVLIVALFSTASLFCDRRADTRAIASTTTQPLTQAPIPPQPITDGHAAGAHLFHYVPDPGQTPGQVHLAGDFNGWSTNATPMLPDGDGYSVKLTLDDGVHHYKFVVDGQWINDPASDAEMEVPDNFGGKNSAVLIGMDARKLPPIQPDQINTSAIVYDPQNERDCNVASPAMLRLSLRTQADGASDVAAMVQAGDGTWQQISMGKTNTGNGLDRYGTLVDQENLPTGSRLRYYFQITNGASTRYVARGMAYGYASLAKDNAYVVEMTPKFETPDWAKHAIWYQIFPERFRNGDPSNDSPKTQKWTSAWWSQLPGETGKFYNDVWGRRYGGDIQGIREKLPYLRELGINAIYLNPIFQAVDVHKYDTSDYRHVDEHFGVAGDIEQLQGETDDPSTWQWTASDKVFLDFLADAHKQGFKVIIDGVFNHVGRQFWAFQDVLKNGKNSKYAGWFDITDWTPSNNAPFHYHAWDHDDGALPALKKDGQLGIVHGPREHLLAITRRWLAPDGDPSRGVDGFRLDAPEGIPHPFWVDWRKLAKSIKPDAYISGEIWGWAQPWLNTGEYDGVMNYRFAVLSQDFFVNQANGLSPRQLNSRCNELIFNYPFQSVLVNQNLLDSHDTDRVASMFVNPDRPFDGADRIQDNGPDYNPAKPDDDQRSRMLQSIAFQMTFVGAPMIYYGDEAGMWSPDDPSNRQPMLWKDLEPYDDPQVQFDQDKFNWYQRLIAIRRKFPALQTGFFHPMLIDDGRGEYAFSRDLGNQHVIVVLNHTGHDQTVEFKAADHDAKFIDWLSVAQSDITPMAPDKADARPDVTANPSAPKLDAPNGVVDVPLPAWGAAVLTESAQ